MPDYILLLRDNEDRWPSFPPDEQRRIIDAFLAWNDRLTAAGAYVNASKLAQGLGKTVRARGDDIVVDGPYSEAKEAVVGFYRICADDYETACRLAGGCPILTYGGSVEVREIFAPPAKADTDSPVP